MQHPDGSTEDIFELETCLTLAWLAIFILLPFLPVYAVLAFEARRLLVIPPRPRTSQPRLRLFVEHHESYQHNATQTNYKNKK